MKSKPKEGIKLKHKPRKFVEFLRLFLFDLV